MKAVLDAGAFLAVEKRDRRIGAMLRVLQQRRVPLWTSAAVVAQVWRDGARQVAIARMLAGVGIEGLEPDDGKRVGQLLAIARTHDIVDAHVALLIGPGDLVFTSDPEDLRQLLSARKIKASVIVV